MAWYIGAFELVDAGVYSLVPANAYIKAGADPAVISQTHAFVPINATVTASAPSPPFYQIHAVVPINAIIKAYADPAIILQIHTVAPINAYIKAGADDAIISQIHSLTPKDAYIKVTGIGESLFQNHFIAPANSYIKAGADPGVILQIHSLVPTNSYILSTDDGLLFTITGSLNIVPINATIFMSGVSESLSQIHFLNPLNSYILVSAPGPDVVNKYVFNIENATNFLYSSVTDVFQIHNIVPGDAYIRSGDYYAVVTVVGGGVVTIDLIPVNSFIKLTDDLSNITMIDLSEKINIGHSRSRSRKETVGDKRLICDSCDIPIHHSRR